MAGFGDFPFGSGPFGNVPWAEMLVSGNVPPAVRAEDAGELAGLLQAFEEELTGLRGFLDAYKDQRDPYRVRSESTVVEVVPIVSSEVITHEYYGQCVQLIALGGAQIENVGSGWFVRREQVSYEVLEVNSRDLPNMVLLRSDSAPVVSGPSTDFSFFQESLVELLGADYGVEVDRLDDEFYQRSQIANIVRWLEIKSTARSYEIKADISGFDANVEGLFRIDETVSQLLPADDVFELPAGSGQFYTTVEPRALLFDEVVADVVALDQYCYPGSAGETFAEDIGDFTVSLVEALTDEEAAGYGLSQGWRMTGTMASADRDKLADMGSVNVSFVEQATSDEFISEVEVSWDGATLVVVVGTVSGPPTGLYRVRYQCPVVESCSWCRSYKLRVDITPLQRLIDTVGNRGGTISLAATRLVGKFEQVLPVHVESAEYLQYSDADIAINKPTVAFNEDSVAESIEMSVADRFDFIPDDAQPLDSGRMRVVVEVEIT